MLNISRNIMLDGVLLDALQRAQLPAEIHESLNNISASLLTLSLR